MVSNRSYRVYWCLILAFAGLILNGASKQPESKRRPETSTTAEKSDKRDGSPVEVGKPADFGKPCGKEERNRNPDLCAQWIAAEAARDAANWTYAGLWLSGASVVGLFITLGFNYAAWDQVRKSKGDTIRALNAADRSADAATTLAAVAADNAQKQLRAYLDFDFVRVDENPEFVGPLNTEGRTPVLFKVQCRNFGKTPAHNVEMSIASKYRRVNSEKTSYVTSDAKPVTFFAAVIAPTDHFTFNGNWALVAGDAELFASGKVNFHVEIIVTYTSVFGSCHVLRGTYESMGIKDDFGIVEGTRAST